MLARYIVHQKDTPSEQVVRFEAEESGLSDEKMAILLEAMGKQGHLKQIKLKGEKIGPKSLEIIMERIRQPRPHCLLELELIACRSLDLKSTTLLLSQIRDSSDLSKLTLSHFKLRYDDKPDETVPLQPFDDH